MPVRRAVAAVLALPILFAIYLPLALRRGAATRIALAVGMGGLIIAAAIGVPAGTSGAPPTNPGPLAANALGPVVATDRSVTSSLIVDFGAPMDAASVEGALSVEPASSVTLGWSQDGQRLSVAPVARWLPATFYTVTVGTAARDRDGRRLASPLRAGFLTRAPTTGRLTATDRLPSGVALDSAIVISFDHPVRASAVLRAFRIEPDVPGELLIATDGPEESDSTTAENFVWQPLEPFTGDGRYRVELAEGILDADGTPVTSPDPLVFAATAAPSVVRFRPLSGTDEVSPGVPVSVRFTMRMNRASTTDAFSVAVNGTRIPGSVKFAENDTVLVFDPKADLPYGASVVLRVAAGAQAANGTPIDRPRAAHFSVAPKPTPVPTPAPAAAVKSSSPAPKPAPTPAPKPAPKPSPIARPPSSSWVAAEKYLLTLLNCTRGGGWVLADGSCSSPGGSGIAALKLDAGISTRVARPYARKLALSGVCSHFSGGDPGDRLRAAGYTSFRWAENIGCRYFADPRNAAVSLVRFFQDERSWNGGHWVNMMNRDYDRAGVGLWVAGGQLRFVIDFYRP